MTKDIDQKTGLGKVCTKCGEWQILTEYRASSKGKNGLHSHCKRCAREYAATRRKENPEAARARDKLSREKYAEKRTEYAKKQYWENRKEILEAVKQWAADNPEKRKATRKRHYDANKDQEKKNSDRWRAANPEGWREIAKRATAKQMATPKGKLVKAMRGNIWRGLSKDGKVGKKTFEALGYTVDELRSHIQSLFQPGMTWENYGRGGWVVDHRIPLAAHNFSTVDDIDFKRAWALSNLQPMWDRENTSKGAKLDAPFQPSLALSIPANTNTPAKEAA